MRGDRTKIALGIFATGLCAALLWAGAWFGLPGNGQSFGPSEAVSRGIRLLGWLGDEWRQRTVMVIVVGDARKLSDVRAVVKPGEILGESRGAFALRRRQVIAASYGDVGPLLQRVGWQEASLELLGPSREVGSAPSAASSTARELAELSQKSRLSELEAQRLLELME